MLEYATNFYASIVLLCLLSVLGMLAWNIQVMRRQNKKIEHFQQQLTVALGNLEGHMLELQGMMRTESQQRLQRLAGQDTAEAMPANVTELLPEKNVAEVFAHFSPSSSFPDEQSHAQPSLQNLPESALSPPVESNK